MKLDVILKNCDYDPPFDFIKKKKAVDRDSIKVPAIPEIGPQSIAAYVYPSSNLAVDPMAGSGIAIDICLATAARR